ncbi:P68 family surface lipoprotein [Mesomycoplasma flocculare]|uniref:P68 family surface lipoprotein n=1 Tax=Mesomycoplasma flocculare TaxID=2128 RepID=UPI0002CE10EF|nr:P80 family lipoprotein [Mesomycoplasma flocculare]ENX51290.1 lipoprotein [Mesomycoplasma flocculare ATCC 27716]
MKRDNTPLTKSKISNKIRSIFLTSLLTVSPIAFLGACISNNTARFDSIEDGKLVFGHSFSSTGNETKALQKIIELWNTTANQKKDFIKMEEQYFQGGYSRAASTINSYLETKGRIKLPNIVTNYSSLLAIVNKYQMTFPLVSDFKSDVEPQEEQEKITKNFLKEQGISEFLEINSEIPFLDTKGIYTLPFGKSTETLTINKILLGWIIEKALKDEKKPATIKEEDKPYFAQFQKLATEKNEDIKEIEKIWKNYVSNEEGLAGYQFQKSDLENFTDLQKLSSRIIKSFPEALSGSALNSAKSALGIDNHATLIFALARSLSEGDKSKEITVLDRQKNLIDFTSYMDQPNSDRYKNFEKIYNLISEGIKDRSIYFTSPGEYNSTYFRNHQQVFSIGSTSGYFHNFVKANAKNYLVGFFYDGSKRLYNVSRAQYAAVIKATDLTDISKDLEILAIDQKSKIKIKSAILPRIKELIEKNKRKEVFYFTNKSEKPSGIVEGSYEVLDLNENFKPIIIPSYAGMEQISGSAALNEGEFDMVAAPHKFARTSKIIPVVSQGPDLILIHATEKEDRAIKTFINWVLTEKVDFGGKFGKITPIEYFSKSSSYLLPLKSTLDSNVLNTKNLGQKVSFNQFSKFIKADSKSQYSLVFDNVDAVAGVFRTTLDSTVAQMQSLHASDGKLRNFSDFLKTLRANLGPAYRVKN